MKHPLLPTDVFLVVAHDPETYETLVAPAEEIVAAWTGLMFCPADQANPEEVAAFEAFLHDIDNWHFHDGKPCVLVWRVGGESNGTITFFRLTHRL